MKRYIFPYGFGIKENGRVITFPAVKITLIKEKPYQEFSFLILVDSGAEVSLFTRSDAELLGIELEKGKRIEIGTVSGEKFSAFLHPVNLRIGEEVFKIKAAFSERDGIPRVLGRNPIFSYFFIVFDDEDKNTIFIPRKSKNFEKFLYELSKN